MKKHFSEPYAASGHLRSFCSETPIFIVMNNCNYRREFLSYEAAIGLIRKDFAWTFPKKQNFGQKRVSGHFRRHLLSCITKYACCWYSDTSFHFSPDAAFCLTFTATGNANGDRISFDFCSEAFSGVSGYVADSFWPSCEHYRQLWFSCFLVTFSPRVAGSGADYLPNLRPSITEKVTVCDTKGVT